MSRNEVKDRKRPFSKPKIRLPIGGEKKPNPIISITMIEDCIPLIAHQIKDFYIKRNVSEVIFVPILHGAHYFHSDLTPHCALQPDPKPKNPDHNEYESKFAILNAYLDIKSQMQGGKRQKPVIAGGDVARWKDGGRYWLLLDDLCETGETLITARNEIAKQCGYGNIEADEKIRVATFVWKKDFPGQMIKPDWFGFATSSHYLAGYGMDGCERKYRNLPSIFVHDSRTEYLHENSWAYRFDQNCPF